MAGNGRRLTVEERRPLIGRALHLRNLGNPQEEIGRQLGVSTPTAAVWIKSRRWERERQEHTKVCEFCAAGNPVPVRRRPVSSQRPIVLALHAEGVSQRAIAARTGASLSSVQRWLRAARSD